MPTGSLERALGAKQTNIYGSDSETLSICTAQFGSDTTVKLQYAKPGTTGLPTDLQTMLAMPREMQAQNKTVVIKEFGDVGCYSMTLAMGGQTAASSLCGNPKGFISIAVSRSGSTPVAFDTVRNLLAEAQSKI